MTDRTGIALFCDTGYLAPDAYLKSVMSTPLHTYGTVVKSDPNSSDLLISHAAGQITPDHIKKVNKTFEGMRILHFFSEKPLEEQSRQPFQVLVSSKQKPILAATLVGDFKHHLPTEATRLSPEWWCVHQRIVPMMQRIWRLCKEDPQTFKAELETMQPDLLALIGPQGGVITLIHTDSIHNYLKSYPTFKKFQWGFTTDVLDYVSGVVDTTPAKEAVDEPDEEVVVLRRKTKAPAVAETSAAKKDEAQTVAKPAETEQKKAEASSKASVGTKEKEVVLASGATIRQIVKDDGKIEYWALPPLDLTKRRALRRFYLAVNGRSLTNQEIDKRPAVKLVNEALIKEAVKRFQEQKVLDDTPPWSANEGSAETAKEVVEGVSTTTGQTVSKVVSEPEPDKGSAPSVHEEREKEYPPGGTPAYARMNSVQKHFVTKFLKTLGNNGQAILNPALDQELENTLPQFYKDIGYDSLDQTLGWDFNVRRTLAAKSPEAMAAWSGDLIRCIKNLEKDLEALTDPAIKQPKRRTQVG